MASSLNKVILIALICTIAIPISTARKHKHHKREKSGDDEKEDSEIESYLRDLCSETKKSKQCWKFLEPEVSRFPDTNSKSVAGVVLDLAIDKSREISEKLNQLYQDTSDDQLREKYNSCASNYNDARNNLGIAKEYLDSDNFRLISAQIDDVKEELKSCRHEFDKDSDDPAHIRNRNKEFGVYVEIVRVAADRFLKEKDGDGGDGGDKKHH